MHMSEQKQKRQRFYALKKHLRERELLVRLYAFCAFCACKIFSQKKRKFKVVLIASSTLLLI